MSLRLRNCPITKLQNRSRGYILISLMLFLSLLAIAALAVLPDIAFQIKREREEEMIHRGLAYARGVRRFYRKFGRYPSRIEELENTNNLHFIRKRYTDPINRDEAFKILRLGDPQLATTYGLGKIARAPGLSPTAPQQGATDQQGKETTTTDTTKASSGDASNPSNTTKTDSSSSGSSSSSGDLSGQVFGGGPILGVVSMSKNHTIREFCNKNHYNDWLFIYDPRGDRGALLNTPWCPILVGQGLNPAPAPPPVSPQLPNTPPPGVPVPTPNPPNPGSEPTPQQ